jgi:hypothetical protein
MPHICIDVCDGSHFDVVKKFPAGDASSRNAKRRSTLVGGWAASLRLASGALASLVLFRPDTNGIPPEKKFAESGAGVQL